ncbi:hypothetical protein Tco_0867702, partial [Tanacetum coccineum]
KWFNEIVILCLGFKSLKSIDPSAYGHEDENVQENHRLRGHINVAISLAVFRASEAKDHHTGKLEPDIQRADICVKNGCKTRGCKLEPDIQRADICVKNRCRTRGCKLEPDIQRADICVKNGCMTRGTITSPLTSFYTFQVLTKCFFYGMPDLKMGLNDKIGLNKEFEIIKSRPTKSGKTLALDDSPSIISDMRVVDLLDGLCDKMQSSEEIIES